MGLTRSPQPTGRGAQSIKAISSNYKNGPQAMDNQPLKSKRGTHLLIIPYSFSCSHAHRNTCFVGANNWKQHLLCHGNSGYFIHVALNTYFNESDNSQGHFVVVYIKFIKTLRHRMCDSVDMNKQRACLKMFFLLSISSEGSELCVSDHRWWEGSVGWVLSQTNTQTIELSCEGEAMIENACLVFCG